MIRSASARLRQLIEGHMAVAILVFVVTFCAVYGVKLSTPGGLEGDGHEYIRSAYFLARHGVYADNSDRDDVTPAYKRPPGYSFFLAGLYKIIPPIAHDDFDWLFPPRGTSPQAGPSLIYVQYVQGLLLLATAMMMAWLTWDTLKRPMPAYLMLWFIGFHPFLGRYAGRFYREEFGAFLIAAFALTLYLAMKRRRMFMYLLAGGILGILTLTLAQWKYIGAAGIAVAAVCTVLQRQGIMKGLLGLAALAVVWVAVFYPWELRNQRLFGHKFLSTGGGAVLEVRSQYNLMPVSSYFSAFAYWSRSPLLKKGLLKLVDKRHYMPLMRDEAEGYYNIAKRKQQKLTREMGPLKADLLLKKQALDRIKAHPVRHLLTTLPVGFRLMMNPMFSILYIPVYLLFGLAVYLGVKKRNWLLVAVLASPLMLFCFNALTTHGLARYNGPGAPLLIFGAMTGWSLWRREKNPHGQI